MCEWAQFSNIWDTKDPQQIEENKTLWLFYDGAISTTIDSQLCLSPTFYDKYNYIAAFQVTMHNVQIRAHKEHAWHSLPYMTTEAEIE